MATQVQSTISAMIPDLNDLAVRYPRHVGMAQGVMNSVWSLVSTPETFFAAKEFAVLGFPPVSAVADRLHLLHQTSQINAKWDLVKQFAGVAVAVLMEHNGWMNAGRKRTIPHHDWNVGTCFCLQQVVNHQQTPATT